MTTTPVKHDHADTMGIGKAIAVLTSGGDAQGKWTVSSRNIHPLGQNFYIKLYLSDLPTPIPPLVMGLFAKSAWAEKFKW